MSTPKGRSPAKLIVLSGLSGAAKSTFVAEMLCQNPRLAVAAADDLRFPEDVPSDITMRLVALSALYLRWGRNVLVDACNLHEHDRIRWETIAWSFGAQLEWITISTPLAKCIEQDAARADPVGAAAILAQVACGSAHDVSVG